MMWMTPLGGFGLPQKGSRLSRRTWPSLRDARFGHDMNQFGNAKLPSSSNYLHGKWNGTYVGRERGGLAMV
jgi:hypothetical protein